jgi:Holliday junction resolvase RusA-like endonuclease
MSDYEFTLPIYGVVKPTKNNKNCALTFNWAQAANSWTYNAAKKKFKLAMQEQLNQFDPIEGQIKIHYVYYAKRNGTDVDNFVAVVKKFFQDCLSESGLIPDDNSKFIIGSSEGYAGIDKHSPRVEAFITVMQ